MCHSPSSTPCVASAFCSRKTRDVTQTTVYLTDLSNAAGMNEVYRTYFPVDPPARATVRVDLGHPDFLLEIQGTAYIG